MSLSDVHDSIDSIADINKSVESIKFPLNTYSGVKIEHSENIPISTQEPAWFTRFTLKTRVKTICLLAIFTFVATSIGPAYYPCIIPIENDFENTSAWQLGLSNYIHLFCSAVMFGFWASLCQRFSRKWILFIAFLGASFTLFLTSGTRNIISLSIFRGISAMLTSSVFPISQKIISDIIPPSNRGRATLFVVTNQVTVLLIVPLLSGGLLELSSWRFVFISLSGIFIILSLLLLFILPDTMNKEKRIWVSPFESILVIFESFELFSVISMICIEAACMYFIYLIIALDFPVRYTLTPVEVGVCYFIIAVCYIIGGFFGFLFTMITHKHLRFAGRMFLPVIIFISLAILNFIIGWSINENRFWFTFSIILTCAGLRGFIIPGAVSYCIELQTKNSKSILGGLITLQMFLSFIAQMIGTILDTQISYSWTFTIISVLMILSCIPVLFFILRRSLCKL